MALRTVLLRLPQHATKNVATITMGWTSRVLYIPTILWPQCISITPKPTASLTAGHRICGMPTHSLHNVHAHIGLLHLQQRESSNVFLRSRISMDCDRHYRSDIHQNLLLFRHNRSRPPSQQAHVILSKIAQRRQTTSAPIQMRFPVSASIMVASSDIPYRCCRCHCPDCNCFGEIVQATIYSDCRSGSVRFYISLRSDCHFVEYLDICIERSNGWIAIS